MYSHIFSYMYIHIYTVQNDIHMEWSDQSDMKYMYIHMNTNTYTCVFMYTYLYIHVYTYIYIFIRPDKGEMWNGVHME